MNAKNRTFAIGAVLVMCLTALTCVHIVSDESDSAISVPSTNVVLMKGNSEGVRLFGPYDWPANDSGRIYAIDPPSGLTFSNSAWSSIVVTADSGVADGKYVVKLGNTAHPGYVSTHNVYVQSGANSDYVEEAKDTQAGVYFDYTFNLWGEGDIYDVTIENNLAGLSYQNIGGGLRIYGTPSVSGVYVVMATWWNVESETDEGCRFVVCASNPNYTHTLTYDGNGNTGGSTADTVVTDQNGGNTNVTLTANGFTKAGYTFTGWKVGNNTYQPGQSIPVGANGTVTATAQWSQNTLNATANNISGVSGQAYSNQIGASANNGGTVSYAVKSCTGGTATVNSSGLVTYTAPSVSSTTSFTVTVTVTATFADSSTISKDVSFAVTVDPVLSFTNAATSGTLSVKGA